MRKHIALCCLLWVSCSRKAEEAEAVAVMPPAEAVAEAPPPVVVVKARDYDVLWGTASPDGTASLELRSGETCPLVCTDSAQTVWTLEQCIVSRDDLRFVANDCSAVLVLLPYPKPADPRGKTVLLRAIENGKLVRELTALDLGATTSKPGLRWLGGIGEELGNRPRYTEAGDGVEFDVLTGSGRRTQIVPLGPQKPAPTQPARLGAPAPIALYLWENEDGELQVSSLESIPKKFRARARPVSAEVGVVERDLRTSPAPVPVFNTPGVRIVGGGFAPVPAQQAPIYDADGLDKNGRNIYGENAAEYQLRIRSGLPPARGYMPTAKPSSCLTQGAGCSLSTQCCSGACRKGSCQ